jgi:GTP pyrophosphokinase
MSGLYEIERRTHEEDVEYYTELSRKKFTFLRGVCSDGKHPNTSIALSLARELHAGQKRDSGEPYIIHPLSLACDAVGMFLNDDIMLATLLLHDVPEDVGTMVMDLSVDDEVKRAVECMTIRKNSDMTKLEIKTHYFKNLMTNKYALIGKGLDRRNNLSTMATAKGKVSIVKNCFETCFLLSPLLKEAKDIYAQYSNQLHTIRTDLNTSVRDLSALVHIDPLSYKHQPSDELMNLILSAKTEADLEQINEIFIP